VEGEGKVILDWNERLRDLTEGLVERYPGVSAFVHDTHKVYAEVIEDPSVYPQTSGLKNTAGFCKAYAK
jgi:hypothetical protein